MKQCQTIQEQFDDRLDQRLDAAQAATFDAHVAVCASCRQEWESYAGSWNVLGKARGAEPSFGFAARTLRRLHEPSSSPWRWPVLRWAAASVAAVMLAVGLFVFHQREQDTQIAAYQAVAQDRLEDFDVIACLDQLEGDKRL
jgi:predicted anti-sigma-YlaC factor YlaD